MAQWQELLRRNLVQGRLDELYEMEFPRHIRHCMSHCIESLDWHSAAVDANKACLSFKTLLMAVKQQWELSVQKNCIWPGPDFQGMQSYLEKNFGAEPLNLAIILSKCLQEEKKILATASGTQDQTWSELDNAVLQLKQQTSEVNKEIKSLEVLYENLDYIMKNWKIKVEQCAELTQSKAAVQEGCLKQTNFISQTKQRVLMTIGNILKQAEQIIAALTDVKLPEWKRRQQVSCIGSPADTSLDHLQEWFTAVAQVLMQMREELHKLRDQNKKYNNAASSLQEEAEKSALSLLQKLLAHALVVEKQPVMTNLPQRPLIIKTGVRFTAAVRFLANLPEFKCRFKVEPFFDKDVVEATTVKGFRHFAFSTGNSKVLDVDLPDGGLGAEFAHMSIKENKGKAKGSCQGRLAVTEELHIIKFVTVFQHAGLRFDMEASTLPVVIISGSSQASTAWASIMWYNMLSTSEPRNMSLFVEPPPLTWQQLSQVLSWQFLSVGQRELDVNQLCVLKDKLVDNPDDLIHWSKFSKNESAWIWIDGILDLIKKHLVDLWQEGLIMGFVSRNTTEALLQEKQTGNFILRFSESNKDGAISFSWVEHVNGETHVYSVEPYTKKDLAGQSLPDSIYLYSLRSEENVSRNPLLYLYPDIHRDVAFGRYCTFPANETPKNSDGYVNRNRNCSRDPTQPSPPPQEAPMDTSTELQQIIEELFDDICDLPTSPTWAPSPNFSGPLFES
ncbi:signal transducer and activator of transcription 1-alpha/beta-like isoform X2 [Echeneis naucrates]|uniref:Signal transducer and activator of transcription n=1 Tax=Echeneis naucrates TaxID=173247 RepID=A0A665W6G9_ECHNA|nr:signal transducer and activator of transcription 1-alpha/beta-like isoform X2 [Echeneis naucrates]